MRREKVEKRLETVKIWKLTELLELNEDQSVKFFPRFKAMEDQIRDINKQQDRLVEDMEDAIKANKGDGDLKKMMAQMMDLQKKRDDLKKGFLDKSTDILSVPQQAKLLIFDRRFPERMRDAIDRVRDGHRGMLPPMPGMFGGPDGMMDDDDDGGPPPPPPPHGGGW
jgi:hypothetical protein